MSRSTGLILLIAAALKAYGLAIAPIVPAGVFVAPEVQVALVNWELLLGLWLVSGKHLLGAWICAVATFACFAGASFYLGWVGQASCGCFGTVRLNPWYAFMGDLAVLAALGFGRPALTPLWQEPRAVVMGVGRKLAGGLLSVVALFAILVLTGSIVFGSPRAALAFFRGEVVAATPRVADLGQVSPGSASKASFELTNWSKRPVRVIGGTSDCNCYANDDLPLTLPPGQTLPVTITFRLPTTAGFFARKALLRTDCDEARTLVVQVVGRIVEP